MKKQILSVILTLSMVLTFLPAQALAAPDEGDGETSAAQVVVEDGYLGEALLWSLDDAGTLTISINPDAQQDKNYDMPDYATNYWPWSEQRADIKSVVIEDGVTKVGGLAFSSCRNLVNVDLSASVVEIGDNAFSNSSNLPELTLPENLEIIGNEAFASTKLSEITIPASVTSIGGGAFANCKSLKNIICNSPVFCFDSPCLFQLDESNNPVTLVMCLPTAITSGSSYAIPSTVTKIEDYAFSTCTNLTELIIPDGITSIGEFAFQDDLFPITIPGSVKKIESKTLWYLSGPSVTLEEGVEIIGPSAMEIGRAHV